MSPVVASSRQWFLARLACALGSLLLGECFAASAADPASAAESVAGAKAATAQPFDILEFVVDGNTVLPEEAVIQVLTPFVGLARSPEDVDRARAALENLYRDEGYKTVAVSIPRQTVRDGAIQLLVSESRVAQLNVVGSRFHSLDLIREQAPALAVGTVPDFDEVKKNLVALNQQPDQRVTPALNAGALPNTVNIDLAVSDELPLHGSAELNNRNSSGTSELRSTVSLSYDNLWQRGHSLSLSFLTAPLDTKDASTIFGSYLALFHDSPFSLLFSALNSDSDVAVIGDLNAIGKGQTFGIRGLWTLPSDESLYQSLSAGVDYKRYRTSVGTDSSRSNTPLTYYPFSLSYTALLQLPGHLLGSTLAVSFASKKLGSDGAELENSRTFTRGQQFALRGNFSYTAGLPFGLESFMRLDGQWTDQPLVANEQYSAGGSDTVRGYFEAESLGDYGYSGTLELRSPSLSNAWLEQLQGFVFIDGAVLKLRRPTPDSAVYSGLHSTGLGLNFKLLSYLSGSVDWAVALAPGSSSFADNLGSLEPRAHTRNGESRVLFRVRGAF